MSIEKDIQEIKEFSKELAQFTTHVLSLSQQNNELPILVKLAAKEMGVNPGTIAAWMRNGIIPRRQIGNRLVVYRSEIKAAIEYLQPEFDLLFGEKHTKNAPAKQKES